MEYRTIEELAYVIQQAKKAGQPQPIFFLGAGVSKTGGIPLANEIIKDILEKYKDSPFIKKLKDEDKNYVQLMNCLQAYERNELLKGYIDNAKINVTHIYLAQLLHSSYVDYILSVNFDNLMLRALSLYNEFPATYDMAILKDLTTSTIKEKSVVYLHGKHDGLWLLNTEDEMAKVGDILPRIFDSIKNKRPWVVIGYSASDPVFEHIKNLGRFDHDLYWVGYKDSEPNANVKSFLNTKNTNAYFIKGYDSDSFMLKLNEELGLDQPIIMDKPFSSLKNMLGEINDIDEDKHFKGVKDRLEIAKKNVDIAIQQFEKNKVVTIDPNELSIDKLKKEIIELTISEEYDIEKIKLIEEKLNKFNDNSINDSLSDLYFNWGNALGDLAEMKEGAEAESLFLESIDKYKRVIDIKPDQIDAFLNWGVSLSDIAEMKEGAEAESLFLESIDKYKRVIDIKPDHIDALNNWVNNLILLYRINTGKEAIIVLNQALEKGKLLQKLGGESYNLSCVYALKEDKENALKYLEISLTNNEQEIDFVLNDEDWEHYLEDEDFKALINKFR